MANAVPAPAGEGSASGSQTPSAVSERFRSLEKVQQDILTALQSLRFEQPWSTASSVAKSGRHGSKPGPSALRPTQQVEWSGPRSAGPALVPKRAKSEASAASTRRPTPPGKGPAHLRRAPHDGGGGDGSGSSEGDGDSAADSEGSNLRRGLALSRASGRVDYKLEALVQKVAESMALRQVSKPPRGDASRQALEAWWTATIKGWHAIEHFMEQEKLAPFTRSAVSDYVVTLVVSLCESIVGASGVPAALAGFGRLPADDRTLPLLRELILAAHPTPQAPWRVHELSPGRLALLASPDTLPSVALRELATDCFEHGVGDVFLTPFGIVGGPRAATAFPLQHFMTEVMRSLSQHRVYGVALSTRFEKLKQGARESSRRSRCTACWSWKP